MPLPHTEEGVFLTAKIARRRATLTLRHISGDVDFHPSSRRDDTLLTPDKSAEADAIWGRRWHCALVRGTGGRYGRTPKVMPRKRRKMVLSLSTKGLYKVDKQRIDTRVSSSCQIISFFSQNLPKDILCMKKSSIFAASMLQRERIPEIPVTAICCKEFRFF